MTVSTHFHMPMKYLLNNPDFFFILFSPFFFFFPHIHLNKKSMPNVFSKLALQEWGLSMVPHVSRFAKGYFRNKKTIQRSILFVLIFRALLSLKQVIGSIKKSNADDAKSSTKRKQNKKVAVSIH